MDERPLLGPARPRERPPILRFRHWQVGDRVVSFGFGHGTLVSFIDRATWFPLTVEALSRGGSTQKVLAVVVDFAECGLVCVYPESRNLQVIRGEGGTTF